MELEEELDALYAAQLDDFVRVRNERAAALRKAGQRAMAAAVKEQAKPSLTAWVVNQLVRRRRAEVERLLDVGERLRDAHQAALTGGGKAELDEARRAERTLIAELVREAERVLEESGRTPTAAALDRVGRTLRSAPPDEDGRELLAKGRFVEDFEPTGFEALAGLRLPARGAARAGAAKEPAAPRRAAPKRPQDGRAAAREQLREAQQTLAEARSRERELRKRLGQAEREAAEARALAERADAEVESVTRAAREAAAAVTAAERALEALGGPGR